MNGRWMAVVNPKFGMKKSPVPEDNGEYRPTKHFDLNTQTAMHLSVDDEIAINVHGFIERPVGKIFRTDLKARSAHLPDRNPPDGLVSQGLSPTLCPTLAEFSLTKGNP